MLDAALALIGDGMVKVGDDTLAGFGKSVLDARELAGMRDVKSERSRWRTHVVPYFHGQRLTGIKRAHIVEWRDAMLAKTAAKGRGYREAPTRRLSRTTVQNTLNLVRIVLATAVDRGRVKANVAADVRLPRRKGVTHDPWT